MRAYLRGLADEFGESTNAIRLELNRLEEAGLLRAEAEGNKKVYQANPNHPLFEDIRSLVLKHSGITQIIEEVVEHVGDISEVWVYGDFAIGKDSDVIDMIIVAGKMNLLYFTSLLEKAEILIKRRIRYTIVSIEQKEECFSSFSNSLLIWKK